MEDLNGSHTCIMWLVPHPGYQGSVPSKLGCILSEQWDKIILSFIVQISIYKPSEGGDYSCITWGMVWNENNSENWSLQSNCGL